MNARKNDLARNADKVPFYGENVFSMKTMKKWVKASTYKSLQSTIRNGHLLDPTVADEVAAAMKKWAISKGATHFTHWFQPLTGTTAEKHDSFVVPEAGGGAFYAFSGGELIRGEPDASSFPSGGIRSTFEARGYTAWDPTSPAFIKKGKNAATLCIPTAFLAYHGEALDKKTPLLRSVAALAKQVCRLGRLFGIDAGEERAWATLGAEQEYFLIDRKYYDCRLDLMQTGRTLFGCKPAKHQQMEDHYFGAIKPRIRAFMDDLDGELWRLGVPAKTRHNEVCPAQFELAPQFEEQNLAVDHNMIMMEVMREIAGRHGLALLLHEKPFAGVNGSGKHNNWSIQGPDGKNWLTPGENPHENAKFLTVICALMKAIDTHAALIRASVASACNDHRLGANEAPPAIMSIFLGEQLTDVIEQIERGGARRSKSGGFLELGVSSLPKLPRDATDRNRTSPFAFTGNKFEFRTVGSSQSCAGPNVVMNTIVAEALDIICTALEKAMAARKDFNAALQGILQGIVKKHKRILFNGDNYAEAWRDEAEKRGLPNLTKTPEALEALVSPQSVAMFEKYGVLSKRELASRYEVYMHAYDKTEAIEAGCAVTMVRTQILPAALSFMRDVSNALQGAAGAGASVDDPLKKVLADLSAESAELARRVSRLEECIGSGVTAEMIKARDALRETVDRLEAMVDKRTWPLPSYAEMMFMM